MGKKRIPIDEPISGLGVTWDDGTNAYTGARIEEFLKGQLSTLLTEKCGALLIENDQIKVFRSKSDRAEYRADTSRDDLVLETHSLGSIVVDTSLKESSPNPVENQAVTSKIRELEESAVGNIVITESGGVNLMTLYNKSGAAIASAEFTAGGAGQGDSTASYMTLRASIDKTLVKEGDSAMLTWTYAHTTADGVPDGVKATIDITVTVGGTTTYSETLYNVGAGMYTLELKPYMRAGTVEVSIVGACMLEDRVQRGRAYASIQVATLNLETSFNIAESLSRGGYGSSDTIEIPWTITGSGEKEVMMYIDGESRPRESLTVTKGSQNGSFVISGNTLQQPGKHTVQLVAERGDLRSNAIHLDIFKGGGNTHYVGVKVIDPSGEIRTGNAHLTPKLTTKQYEQYVVQYAAYDPGRGQTEVEIQVDGSRVAQVQAPRTIMTYSGRMTTSGEHTLLIRCGSYTTMVGMDVQASDIDVAEVIGGLRAKLDAKGRSNSETNPGVWEDNGVSTAFENVDFATSGWIDGALKLMNGAKAVIGYQPFATNDCKTRGLTIELTMTVSNINDREASILSCMHNGKGLRITGGEIGYLTGTTVEYENEDGELVTRDVKMTTNYVPDRRIKVALIVESERNVMSLYVNGNRVSAETYDPNYDFRQDEPQSITVDSAEADVALETIRFYERALSDDEEIDNWIVDLPTAEEMSHEVKDNDILTEDMQSVDITKLLAKGKSVLRIIRPNKLDDIYAENNKKTKFDADIEFTSAYGREYDFVLRNCKISIQGTSSTKYPSKNLRIYFNATDQTELHVNGVLQPKPNLYTMMPGAEPMNLYTMKSDAVDSSMSLNTGGAKLFNDMMIELGLLTPPQRAQRERGEDITIRTAINGFPVDVFVSSSSDTEAEYVGSYNFNNEKSESQALFGQEGYPNAITLETLNNTNRVCLFTTASNEDLAAEFDNGAEFNYPDGLKWSTCTSNQRRAIQDLHSWIRSCIPSGANPNDISTYRSTKFVNEVEEHFDLDFVLTYYLFTDYYLAVDQRAKNMLIRTWDGEKWYITYYDGDTSMGKRNDGYQAYGYTTDRDTWDVEKNKYAFEGHDSALWNLCLANFGERLSTQAVEMRKVLTKERVKQMLFEEQSGNWSVRASNKTGEIKYITPAIQKVYGHRWPFIFMLQGLNIEQRRYFIDNRFALLDAKYGTDEYRSDAIEMCLSRTASNSADVLAITTSEPYAFGYARKNGGIIGNTGVVQPGNTALLSIGVDLTVNDPISVCGASRIVTLDMTSAAKHLKNTLDLAKCVNMRTLTLDSDDTTGSTAWNISIDACRALRRLSARNQSQFTTSTSSAHVANLATLNKLEYLDLRGTGVTSLTLADGAPISELLLPGEIETLKLRYLHQLKTTKLTIPTLANVRTLEISGCEGIDSRQIVSQWMSQKVTDGGLCSLTLRGIAWSGVSVSELLALCEIGELTVEGRIALSQTPTVAEVRALIEAFGRESFGGNGQLTITSPGDNFLVCAPERITEGESADVPIVVLDEGISGVSVELQLGAGSGITARYDKTTMTVHIDSVETGLGGLLSVTVRGTKGGVTVVGYGLVEVSGKTYPSRFSLNAPPKMSTNETKLVTLVAEDTSASDGEWRVEWSIVEEAMRAYVAINSPERFGCSLRVLPTAPIGTFTLQAVVVKTRDSSPLATLTKRIWHISSDVIMTSETNPEVMAICHAKGWAAHADYMTKQEAAAVTSNEADREMFVNNVNIKHFDEYVHFTGLIEWHKFKGCTKLESIKLPLLSEIEVYGYEMFSGCTRLKEIDLPECLSSLNWSMFYNCTALKKIIIPSTANGHQWASQIFVNCTSVEEIYNHMATAPSLYNNSTLSDMGVRNGCTMYLPVGATGYETGLWLQWKNQRGITYSYTL